jgi:hypothetical protein
MPDTDPFPPLQPMVPEPERGGRFRANALVEYLLDHGGIDMNHLATIDASKEDRAQFAMLIGYSLSGFLELSYVDDNLATRAIEAADRAGLIDKSKRFWWQG